jgi:radical SAM protein (TIGR04043 family)
MPGKATVSMERYYDAFESSVKIFGRGQVSTYILAGLGDTAEAILAACEKLIVLGVYPFVVPFVPVSGTPLAHAPAPSPDFMRRILPVLGRMVSAAGLRSADIKAGCGKCGACSALASYEG